MEYHHQNDMHFLSESGIGETHVKVVYFGPPMSGKYTNIIALYELFPVKNKRWILSLRNKLEHHILWDGLIARTPTGITRFHVYTIPGPVFNDYPWIRLFMGMDGIVFVADAQESQMEANCRYLTLLEAICRSLGRDLETLPMVLQYNKQDLPSALPPSAIDAILNPMRRPRVSSIAANGHGVVETFQTLRSILAGSHPVFLPDDA